jgi:hypothetical protein
MEKLQFSLQVMVIGFSVVLFTLFALYGILLLFSRIFSGQGKKTPKLIPAADRMASGEKDGGLEGRKTAAIVAAVYQYLMEQGSPYSSGQIRIAVRSAGNSTGGWQIIGRKALLENRAALEQIRRNKHRENI